MTAATPGVVFTDKRTQLGLTVADLTSATFETINELSIAEGTEFLIPAAYRGAGAYLAIVECDVNLSVVTGPALFNLQLKQVDPRNPFSVAPESPQALSGNSSPSGQNAATVKAFGTFAVPANGALEPAIQARRLSGTGALRGANVSFLWTVSVVPAGVE